MIELKNLSKRFGKFQALDNINLKVNSGDRIALIGQNGAGKTTLFRIILGQYLHDGELTVLGKNPRQHRVEILNEVGFVPQLPPPIQMSVEELVSFSAKVSRSTTKEEIIEKARELGLEIDKNLKKPFQKLSGGMKQKLLIALALAKKPKILIMDEPAANLDPQGRQAFFLQLFGSLKESTMILSSHRVVEVINLINRIVEIDYGKIVQDDPVSQTALADKMLNCRLTFSQPIDSAAKILSDWNFKTVNGGFEYRGSFIGAERLKFLTTIAHFANHIQQLSID